MSKLDIYKIEWLDVVFADRNKTYGAYELRKDNPKVTFRALLIGGTIFLLAFFAPQIIKLIKGSSADDDVIVKQTEVVLQPPPPVDEKQPPPPPPTEPPKPKVDQVKFPPPVVKPDKEVRDEEPPTVKELEVADPGQKTLKGDPNADINIAEPVGESDVKAVVEDNSPVSFASVEVLPEPQGGMAGFGKYIQQNYRVPEAAASSGNSGGRVTVSFVVEKDGKLTDIKVLRDLGYGTGEEAKRVLAKMPPWKPGIQNGRPVRVAYTLPIAISLQ